MKLPSSWLLVLPLAACASTTSETEWVDYGEDPMQNPQFMQDWMAIGTTGPEHAAMAEMTGEFFVEGKMWMGPGQEPMPMQATATSEMVLDRYVFETFESEFMGMPYQGRLVGGYDKLTERYWSLWMDSMSTGYMLMHGQEIAPGTYEYTGTMRDVMTPDGRPSRMVIRMEDDGGYVMQMFDSTEDGGEFMAMELRYTRK